MNQYFKRPVHQLIVVMPLQETNVINQFDVKCHVKEEVYLDKPVLSFMVFQEL